MNNIRERKTATRAVHQSPLKRQGEGQSLSISQTRTRKGTAGGRRKDYGLRILAVIAILTSGAFTYVVRSNGTMSLVSSLPTAKISPAIGGNTSRSSTTIATRKLSDHRDFKLSLDKIRCMHIDIQKDETFCRPDDIGEFLEEEGATFVHAPLQSIPSRRRIPRSMANNDTYIVEQRDVSPANGTATALVEYNPTLVALYENKNAENDSGSGSGKLSSNFDAKVLDYITGRYLDDITDEEADRVMYVSVQRSTNHHACGVNLRKRHETIAEQCFVAISLLDQDLNVIPGAELVVDLDYYMINKHVPLGARRRSVFGAYNCQMNDVSITAQRSSKDNPKKDQLFLLFSGTAHSNMIPIDLRRILHSADDGTGWDTKIKNNPLPASEMADEDALYGEGLQLRFLDDLVRSSDRTKVIKALQQNAFLDWRKNYHFLEATNDGSTWFEMTPLRNHETRPINFFHDAFEKQEDLNYFPGTSTFVAGERSGTIRRTYKGQTTQSWYRPDPPYPTVSLKRDDIQLPGVKYRGTACCADMDFRGERVKVGITHTVTKERSYLNAFYAFQPFPPFKIVALSGYFCLGGMKSTDIGYDDHWMSQRSIDADSDLAIMEVQEEKYSCPKVAFATGINEMIGSGDNIIISYGVGDCYSRSIVVPKEKIQILLSGEVVGDETTAQKKK